MNKDPKFNLLDFIEKWAKYAGFIAVIASAFAYSRSSFWLSISTVIVGWLLICYWLIVVIRKKAAVSNILLPPNTLIDKSKYFYPDWARFVAILSIIIMTICTSAWSCVMVVSQVRTSFFLADSVSLPSGECPGLSITTESGPLWLWTRVVNEKVDHGKFTAYIDSTNIVSPGEYSPRVGTVNGLSPVHLYVTGISDDVPVQISNRLPVKILSYEPIANPLDLIGMGVGGGDDYWVFEANITNNSINNEDQIVWASYSSNLKEQIKKYQEFRQKLQGTNDKFDQIPSELEKIVTDEMLPMPDYFSLSKNEMIAFSVALNFREPGVYKIVFGIEYIFKGHKSVAWVDSPLMVYVPKDFYLWSRTSVQDQYSLQSVCITPSNLSSATYQCLNRSAENFKLVTTNMAFAPDNNTIAFGQADGTVSVRDLTNGSEIVSLGEQNFQITSIAHGNKKEIVAAASDKIIVWDIGRQKELAQFGSNLGIINHLAFSPDDTMLASATDKIKLWELDGTELAEYKIDNTQVNAIAFSPSGSTLSAGYTDGSIVMWDIKSSTPVVFQKATSTSIQVLAYSQNGNYLITNDSDQGIVVWQIKDKSKLETFSVSSAQILNVAISPDGNSIATASSDAKINVWNIGNKTPIQTFELLLNFPISLAFSSDNTKLIALSPSNLIVWNTRNWVELLNMDPLQ